MKELKDIVVEDEVLEELQEEVVEEKVDILSLSKGAQYVLEHEIEVYKTVNSAKEKSNPKKVYIPGIYFISEISCGMVNLSKYINNSGFWINPSDL